MGKGMACRREWTLDDLTEITKAWLWERQRQWDQMKERRKKMERKMVSQMASERASLWAH
jgi:hypothetical protein